MHGDPPNIRPNAPPNKYLTAHISGGDDGEKIWNGLFFKRCAVVGYQDMGVSC